MKPTQRAAMESALQSVAEKIGSQCAVWYGIGARDVEEVLREAARQGLVHVALAEPEQPNLDTVRLDWLDTLPSGIVIPSDASFPHSLSATPKEPGISHIRELIDQNRASREAFKEKNND